MNKNEMDNTQNAHDKQVLSHIYDEVKRRFTGIDDLAHGWEHVKRVYDMAEQIARQEGADMFVVGAAALLHDLGRAAPPEIAQDVAEHHADLSVYAAKVLLREQHVSQERQEAILHAILAHSFSRGVEPHTLEARIVRDADRLDALGAIGILRWAITGVVRHTPHSYYPEDPFGEQRTLDDTRYMLDHFPRKLLRLEETMLTATGRALAHQRTAFMRQYLVEFRRELEIHFS
jgi:uncharacterized protein